jgi:hypothetical protein
VHFPEFYYLPVGQTKYASSGSILPTYARSISARFSGALVILPAQVLNIPLAVLEKYLKKALFLLSCRKLFACIIPDRQ